MASTYGDQLDEVADFLAEFALQIKSFGPKAHLQSKAHRRGKEAFDNFEDTED